MLNAVYLHAFLAPYLKKTYLDIKNVDGDMFIIVYFENEERYRVSLNELNASFAKGKIFDDNKLTAPHG